MSGLRSRGGAVSESMEGILAKKGEGVRAAGGDVEMAELAEKRGEG